MRFRPILMTSFAFILGIWPLVNATGAGAAGRRSLGTAVFGGMLAATILAVLFVPVFYVLMQRIAEFRFRNTPLVATPSISETNRGRHPAHTNGGTIGAGSSDGSYFGDYPTHETAASRSGD